MKTGLPENPPLTPFDGVQSLEVTCATNGARELWFKIPRNPPFDGDQTNTCPAPSAMPSCHSEPRLGAQNLARYLRISSPCERRTRPFPDMIGGLRVTLIMLIAMQKGGPETLTATWRAEE